jgi:lipoprotein-anchoring transpeptidase ErfK/SrfK
VTRPNHPRDSGSATVLMITLCFTFLAGSLVWLSRTVDQSLDDRTNAAAIAFQAARAGAQEIDPVSARSGASIVDPIAARTAVASTTARLLAANGDSGTLTALSIEGNRVTVSVTITTTGRPATGTASATAIVGVDAPLP